MPPGPRCVPVDNRQGCLPVAPAARRVDLTRPGFSRPLQITNPLHPTAVTSQVIYGGQVDGMPFRTEFTRLAGRKVIAWEGQRIEAVTMQYLAFSDGRIKEVALDWFAQADDGSVWYLGEDVFNYADGMVADTEGTWQAGTKQAPPAMIMPAAPKTGDVYRPENAPGVVFEEVTVTATGRTVAGPSGPVAGAIVVNELHADGSREDKTFAPGYGQFSTGSPAGDLEAASLAVPVDARQGPVPARLTALSRAARTTYDAVAASRWSDASAAYRSLRKAWADYHPGGTLIDRQMSTDIASLGKSIMDRSSELARGAALRVAQNDLDLRLRYVPLATIEKARADLWRRQLAADTRAGDQAAAAGDRAALKWTSDRLS
jgi:hypothetical protein